MSPRSVRMRLKSHTFGFPNVFPVQEWGIFFDLGELKVCDLARPLNAAKLAQFISQEESCIAGTLPNSVGRSSSSCSRVHLNALLKAAYRICVHGSEQLH